MSKSRHTSHPAGHKWNPPPRHADVFPEPTSVVSATECTGLEARPMIDREDAEHDAQLYAILPQKSQGNIGKGNPRNDDSEIEFHRTHRS